MASEVYTTEIVTLLNGDDVELRPLSIARLRKFMRIWNKTMRDVQELTEKVYEGADEDTTEKQKKDRKALQDEYSDKINDIQYDSFVQMCSLALAPQLQDEMSDKEFLEYLEDCLDDHTIKKILDVCGGLRLNDTPNQTTEG